MSTGLLTPYAAVEAIYHDALHHLDEPSHLCFIKNVSGAIQLGLAGLTSMVIAGGCPQIKATNPGLNDFFEGAVFSIGLIFVYFTGGELFTGYPMWLSIAALKRKRKFKSYVVAATTSLLGNLVGSLFVATFFSYATHSLSDEPWRSYVTNTVDETITDSTWGVIFLKATACGYLVTLAMLLGTQNLDGISKALALWLPFFLATACKFPHTIKYMHLGTIGMLLGARMTVAEFIWKCEIPVILGNTLGGAVFTGAYHWWVYLYMKNGEEKHDTTFGQVISDYTDGDEQDT